MNWEVAAAIAEVVGAVAVVVSLIYLAVQIRQNTRVVRGSTLDAITAHQQSELRWSSETMTATFVAKVESIAGVERRRVKDALASVLRRQAAASD